MDGTYGIKQLQPTISLCYIYYGLKSFKAMAAIISGAPYDLPSTTGFCHCLSRFSAIQYKTIGMDRHSAIRYIFNFLLWKIFLFFFYLFVACIQNWTCAGAHTVCAGGRLEKVQALISKSLVKINQIAVGFLECLMRLKNYFLVQLDCLFTGIILASIIFYFLPKMILLPIPKWSYQVAPIMHWV